jgi:hypothetical protein
MSICLAILVRNHTVATSVEQSSPASQHWEIEVHSCGCEGIQLHALWQVIFLCIYSFTTMCNVHSNVKAVPGSSLHMLFTPNTYGHMRRSSVAGNGWRLCSVEGYYNTRWLTGLWSTQAIVEVIVLKAAWQWGSDSIVIKNPLGEPRRTPLYVRPSAHVGLRGWWPYVFPLFRGRAP